ncbi:B12-binding domain-containing radical SAM protein [archaeon]|jgi:anaerobic magnesium-protoporphyrin IX monomethyl ester cyclase|nr:B12-binding domain-containing radical SAM protein [archaeon]MBT6698104.1 B12-binding domain-containing radical SAM protein [archaeon]
MKQENNQSLKILLLAFNLQEDVFPLGLSYLKTYAQKFHQDVNLTIKEFTLSSRANYETNKNAQLAALSYIELEQPDLVAFSCYIWSADTAKDFAMAVKQLSPNTKVLLGGVEVTKENLTDDIDYIISGEGEIAFKELIDHLKGQRELEEVHNITTRNKTTNKVITTPKAQIQNLDELPFPYIIGQNHQDQKNDYAVIRMETARGCLYSCNFCHYAKPDLRFFSIDYIKNSLTYLFDNYNFKYLTFLDANFNTKKERMFEILNLIKDNIKRTSKQVATHIELRPELIDKDTCIRLNELGKHLTIDCELGFQSSDSEVQKAANRPTNMDKVKQALSLLNQYHIRYKIDLMYGLPKDNFYKFLSSVRFILSHANQKKIVAHHYMQLNNTEFKTNPQHNKYIKRINKNASSMVIKTEQQTTTDLYLTKLFTDQLNNELSLL